jgi:hypothetical protein
MMSHRYYPQPLDSPTAAFDRVRRVSRWITAGATASVVVIIGAVAHQIPGRSTSAATTTNEAPVAPGQSPATSTTAGGGSTISGSGHSASQPAMAPTPTRQAPVAVSGGSGF